MRNKYLVRLSKIEFVVTNACTGRCKHCSEGDHAECGERISPEIAQDAVRKICGVYDIKTVMAFGGEPLLYPDAVYAIMTAARELSVPRRQLITNGFFTNNTEKIKKTAHELASCGINDLLLSADAFHQETIPIETVKEFAIAVRAADIPVKIQPAWLKSREDCNPYNQKTREIIAEFRSLGISENDGNVIFPEGNAKKYLSEYFTDTTPENPYVENPRDVRCVSFSPNGNVLDGNVYERDIMQILSGYGGELFE